MFIRYLTFVFLLIFSTADAATITISCDSTGIEGQLCKRHAQDWAKANGHEVKFFHHQPVRPKSLLCIDNCLLQGRLTSM